MIVQNTNIYIVYYVIILNNEFIISPCVTYIYLLIDHMKCVVININAIAEFVKNSFKMIIQLLFAYNKNIVYISYDPSKEMGKIYLKDELSECFLEDFLDKIHDDKYKNFKNLYENFLEWNNKFKLKHSKGKLQDFDC